MPSKTELIFPKDLTDPPDGGYSFIEYEELEPVWKISRIETRTGVAVESFVRSVLLDMLDGDLATANEARVIDRYHLLIEKRRKQIEDETLDATKKQWGFNRSPEQVRAASLIRHQEFTEKTKIRVLTAEAHEIMRTRNGGGSLRKVKCASYVLAWMAVRPDTGMITHPGELVLGFATTDAFTDGPHKPNGTPNYACWVMTW